MTCLECTNLTSHSQKMALQGYGNCKQRREWTYLSIISDRECAQFVQVSPEVAKTRETWAAKVGAA